MHDFGCEIRPTFLDASYSPARSSRVERSGLSRCQIDEGFQACPASISGPGLFKQLQHSAPGRARCYQRARSRRAQQRARSRRAQQRARSRRARLPVCARGADPVRCSNGPRLWHRRPPIYQGPASDLIESRVASGRTSAMNAAACAILRTPRGPRHVAIKGRDQRHFFI
jgi:hypothetical protein